ncbi:MAG TPA: fumarylacetoacetate hydrolase family protein [Dehalococcoidia bacterium]|nr:fumarylacetoacetate hydrolase family protein [Dehalococcoidia bacterium]
MKIVRFSSGRKTRYGILNGQTIQVISGSVFHSYTAKDEYYQLSDVKLLAPCQPSKIAAIGLNYRSHAEESGMAIPELPLIFLKPSTCIIGPEDAIVYPEMSKRVDYEGEFGVVIGRKASHVSPQESLDYVLGYTCFNDVSARDLQASDGQWSRAKGFDTFGSFGPCIETELDPGNTPVETYLNGELKQQGNTNDLIHSVPDIISFVSRVMTLLPGDVIATGTPSGVGPMSVGDSVEIKIEPIGVLRNHVVSPD